MKTKNPNFPVPKEIKGELDLWFGEGKYTPLICWNDYHDNSVFFVVVKTEYHEGRIELHMVRLFKMYDFQSDNPIENYTWALSVDAQE